MDHSTRAKQIISEIAYATIASVSGSGEPWNSPVYCAFDDAYNFYWSSPRESQHSKNIVERPDVFLVIYDSTVPEGTGQGVYVRAVASELGDPAEIEKALGLIATRKSKPARMPDEYLGQRPRRVYKAVPVRVWVNVDGDVSGNVVDMRAEVRLG